MGDRCVSRLFGPRQQRIQTRSNGCVAVPYCDEAISTRIKGFYREIVGWKHLSHPNVLPFLGISETEFPFSIISPWLPNGDIINYTQKYRRANRLHLVRDHRSDLRAQTV